MVNNRIFKNCLMLIVFTLCISQETTFGQYSSTGRLSVSDLFNMSLEGLMDIKIVSATKKAQSIADAPAIVTVITSQQIAERGYSTVAEALECVVGLDIIQDHFQPNVGVRGINGGMRSYSRIVKVMIDGQAVSNRSNSDNYLGASLIPMSAIERIEIIKGPNSALYGADAYLGVINIITKRAEDIAEDIYGGVFSASSNIIEDNKGYGNSMLFGQRNGNLQFLIAISSSRENRSGLIPQDIPRKTGYSDAGKKSANDLTEPMSVFGKIGYDKENIGTIGIDFSYQRTDAYGEFQDWGVLTGNNRISLYNAYIRGTYYKKLSEKLETNLSLTYAGGAPTLDEKLNIGTDDWVEREVGYEGFDVKAEVMYNIDEKNSFTAGSDYTNDSHTHQTFYTLTSSGVSTVNPDWVKGNYDVPDKFTNTGLYLQAILNPSSLMKTSSLEKLSLTAGIRLDDHSVYGSENNWRIAGVYKFSDNTYTKLLYGTSFKAPTSTQLYTNFLRSGGVIGNPDLEPETANIIDLQVAGKINKYLFFNIDGFASSTQNKVELGVPEDAETINIRALNSAKISSYGLESEIIFSYSKLSSFINYSYQKSKIKRARAKNPSIEDEYDVNLYPSHMVKFGVNQKVPSLFLNIYLEGRYTDARIASDQNAYAADIINWQVNYAKFLENRYKLDYYFLLDVAVSTNGLSLFDDKETKFMVKIYNALDKEHAFPGFKENQNFDIPGLGRSYLIQIVQYL